MSPEQRAKLIELLKDPSTATFIRTVIKVGAGMLAHKGWVDASMQEMIIAAAAGLPAVLWGYLEHK